MMVMVSDVELAAPEQHRDDRKDHKHGRHNHHGAHHAGKDRHEQNNTVGNGLPWYAATLSIVLGAALLSYGMVVTIRRWALSLRADETGAAKAAVIANVLAICVASACGALVGSLIWHWALGLVAAFVGAWASPWLVDRMGELLLRNKK